MPQKLDRHLLKDKLEAANWARELLAGNLGDWCILDTETTGLHHPEIIDICIISKYRSPMIDTRLNPLQEIESGAAHIHGLTNESLQDAPSFKDVRDRIQSIVKDKLVIIYNAGYDCGAVFNSCVIHNLPRITFKSDCAMNWYAQFYGEWHSYYGNYKWQKLVGGNHTAYGDCLATHDLIQLMAAWEPEQEDIEEIPSSFKLPIEIGCQWEPKYWVRIEEIMPDTWRKKAALFPVKFPKFYVTTNKSDR